MKVTVTTRYDFTCEVALNVILPVFEWQRGVHYVYQDDTLAIRAARKHRLAAWKAIKEARESMDLPTDDFAVDTTIYRRGDQLFAVYGNTAYVTI